uniref:NADH-ubiquinone oxidoreductase chain 4 n=1 Tax=Ishige okamurae TaxID=233772 RepID=A0A4Y5T8S5_9PHAE|nr:NADH dehydrogenase subunit 4 [Ishige okamurae]
MVKGLCNIFLFSNFSLILFQKLLKLKKLEIKQVFLALFCISFIFSLFLWIGFDSSTPKFQFVSEGWWLPYKNVNFILGLDGISLFFILLTTLLFPLCCLWIWPFIGVNLKFYLYSFSVLESILILAFSSVDLIFFYVFFEIVLIPTFIIIGMLGSRDRKVRAGYLFFFYTLFGSLLMLLGICYIYNVVGSSIYEAIHGFTLSTYEQKWIWVSFFFSFSSKVPLIPLHIWLPEAHVEAPTTGSVLLAGLLLKLGSYGIARYCIGLFPDACLFFTPSVFTLGLLGVIYTSLTAIRQIDFKRLIAYTSIAHMNLVVLGLFTCNTLGIHSSLVQSLSHGFVSSALFLSIGTMYDRGQSRIIRNYSGLSHTMPIFVSVFLFFTLANLGLPGTSSFVGEFLLLTSIFLVSPYTCFFSSSCLILGGGYSLWLFNRVSYGNSKLIFFDVSKRELLCVLPLIFSTFVFGIQTKILLDPIYCTVYNLCEYLIL